MDGKARKRTVYGRLERQFNLSLNGGHSNRQWPRACGQHDAARLVKGLEPGDRRRVLCGDRTDHRQERVRSTLVSIAVVW